MLAAVVAVLVVAALVTAVLSRRDAVEPADGAPEATVQQYVEAVLDHDSEAAVGLLAPDSPCDVEDLDHAYVDDDLRVSLEDVEVSGTAARVDVTITSGSGGLFPSEWTDAATFRLVRTGGEWRITGSPWPLFDCGVLR